MMSVRILLAIIILSSCQTGRIPCPQLKGPRLAKSHAVPKSYTSVMARTEPEDVSNKEAKTAKISQERYVGSVTEEEWDCPQPGSKRYLPRHVKENIRRNFRKMTEEQQNMARDSTGTAGQ
jgi:hypothetical protein